MCQWTQSSLGSVWVCCMCGAINSDDRCFDCDRVVCKEPVPARSKVLIVGCARSGTKYIAELLKMHGARVGHEYYAHDGMAHCMCAIDGVSPVLAYNDRWVHVEHKDFKFIAHQVRHPFDSIASLVRFREEGRFTDYHIGLVERHTTARSNQSPLEFAMRYWLDWNELCRKAARLTYRVEDVKFASREVAPMFGALGIQPILEACIDVSVKTNTLGETASLSFSDLSGADAWLASQVEEQAEVYGYAML